MKLSHSPLAICSHVLPCCRPGLAGRPLAHSQYLRSAEPPHRAAAGAGLVPDPGPARDGAAALPGARAPAAHDEQRAARHPRTGGEAEPVASARPPRFVETSEVFAKALPSGWAVPARLGPCPRRGSLPASPRPGQSIYSCPLLSNAGSARSASICTWRATSTLPARTLEFRLWQPGFRGQAAATS